MSKQRLCLIDDDVAICEAIALGLRDSGYDVIATTGAVAALDILRRGAVDAIITDLNMPGTSGAQLIAEARHEWPDIPIVAISGGGLMEGRDVLEAAKRLGADAAMLKPFRAKQLAELLEQLFAQRPAHS